MTDVMGAVAGNLRRIRDARGLSLNELARQSGVAKATLSQLELGRGNPTVETLMTLATHFGVTLTDLITCDDPPKTHVRRAGEGTLVRGDGLQLRLVHRMTSGPTMYEIYDMATCQGLFESPAHGVGVMEHLMLHQGTMRVGPKDDPAMLEAGDFIVFSADRPHFYESLSPTTQATLIVLYPTGAQPPL
ncbi:helix-turn-helix domain-containing protein [Kitasatospora sp. CM 4170]|uniref:Helix-turn-helix domain-containing protein n=1 Tax=Kitasatospora aburaviensis TaxID=67265 RepID=A0ABW1ESH0_9ACTN|nr:helix-turn-helix domain-containing protein [Kitasatospora sp. CM 4170]WNM44811.1 helix-turn-helix domain-containing protein [Kitasatospora sp. CM 4170]